MADPGSPTESAAVPAVDPALDEQRALSNQLRDMAALLALPALWRGREPAYIAEGLLDVLTSILRLEFAYVRLDPVNDEGAIEEWRPRDAKQVRQVVGAVQDRLVAGEPVVTTAALHSLGDGTLRVVGLSPRLLDNTGVVVAGTSRTDFPTEAERFLLNVAVEQAAIAIDVARSLDRERTASSEAAARARQGALGADIGVALTGSEPLGVQLQHCAEAIVRHLDAAFARIWTLNPTDNVLELQASAGMYTKLDGGHSRVPVGAFKVGMIAEKRKAHLTNDVVDDPRVSERDWARREGIVAFAGYPLLLGERLVGVMAMFARQPLTAATTQSLASVADTIALGIDRAAAEAGRAGLLAREHEARTEAQTLLRVSQMLSAELELEVLVQAVTDAATELSGAQFGAFFYNVANEQGESYMLYTLSGAPREAFERFPLPRNTDVFEPTFRGTGVVRLNDVTADPRYG
ncbi:MAG: GAF domain-containing protein, partial [Vicinamibacterales bacterium]